MSDKELVLDVIQRLPKSVTLKQIRERVEFLAAIKEGEDSLDRGEGVPHAEAKKQLSERFEKASSSVACQRKAIHQAAGIWKRRKNLPDFGKLRREWERK